MEIFCKLNRRFKAQVAASCFLAFKNANFYTTINLHFFLQGNIPFCETAVQLIQFVKTVFNHNTLYFCIIQRIRSLVVFKFNLQKLPGSQFEVP